MAQRRIVVLDTQHRHEIGVSVRDILQQDSQYRVDLIDGSDPRVKQVLGTSPSLIIPVLPAPKERTELLAEERFLAAGIPLLAVISPEDLGEVLDGVLYWTKDFLVAPIYQNELLARVKRILPGESHDTKRRKERAPSETFSPAQLIGEEPIFRAVKRKILLTAESEWTALILGETGTGKELCARAIHYLSRRRDKPFLPVNCGAIPIDLFERELFGHQKGAFTSAWAAQPGLVAEAESGTLFLDEIETLSLSCQAKLLRFLQDRSYCALGFPKLRRADVRIIAATNVDLQRRVREGSFRDDLFYRLAVLTLTLPPLRERPADIPLLATYFWTMHAKIRSGARKYLSPQAIQALCRYPWPGNIRELENTIQTVLVLSEAQTIEPQDLPITLPPSPQSASGTSFRQAKCSAIEHFERAYLSELLGRHNGNVTHAARDAKKDRRALGRLIKKYRISRC